MIISSSGQDLCAISYDNGNIRLYSTFNDIFKLVKGTLDRKYPTMFIVKRSWCHWRECCFFGLTECRFFVLRHLIVCSFYVFDQNLHAIRNASLRSLGSTIDYYVRHQAIKQQLFTMWKQAKKLIYYVAIQWVYEVFVIYSRVHVRSSREIVDMLSDQSRFYRCISNRWSRFDY